MSARDLGFTNVLSCLPLHVRACHGSVFKKHASVKYCLLLFLLPQSLFYCTASFHVPVMLNVCQANACYSFFAAAS